jgi:2-methylisocitrate lyase-like PEP mutase family enzyme
MGQTFRLLLGTGTMIEIATTYDAMSAQLVEKMGFDGVLIGGGLVSMYGHGVADGVLTPGDVIEQVRRVRAVTEFPIMVDLDDAGGSPRYVSRYVRGAEDAGASAVLIEDADVAGRFRWNDYKGAWDDDPCRLQPLGAAADNIRTAVGSRRNLDTVVIARTEALMSLDLDHAFERAQAYVASGADAVFIRAIPDESVPVACEKLGVPIMNTPIQPITPQVHAELIQSGLGIAAYYELTGNPYASAAEAIHDLGAATGRGPAGVEPPFPATAWEWFSRRS